MWSPCVAGSEAKVQRLAPVNGAVRFGPVVKMPNSQHRTAPVMHRHRYGSRSRFAQNNRQLYHHLVGCPDRESIACYRVFASSDGTTTSASPLAIRCWNAPLIDSAQRPCFAEPPTGDRAGRTKPAGKTVASHCAGPRHQSEMIAFGQLRASCRVPAASETRRCPAASAAGVMW